MTMAFSTPTMADAASIAGVIVIDGSFMVHDPYLDLLHGLERGDRKAAGELVRHLLPPLLALAERMLSDRAEAEDVVQDAFERLWQTAHSWRKGRAKLSSWMYKITLNLCLDRLRARRRAPTTTLTDDTAFAVSGDTPEQMLAARQRSTMVRAGLAQLPERQRAALLLSYYQHLSNPEAAACLGVGVRAFESLLARARAALGVTLGAQRLELLEQTP